MGWCWAGGEGAPWRALLGYPPGTVTLAACCCCFWRGMCAADRVPAVQAGAAAAPTATAAPALGVRTKEPATCHGPDLPMDKGHAFAA